MNIFVHSASLSSACGLLRVASPYSLIPNTTLSERPPNIVDILRNDVFIFARPTGDPAILDAMRSIRARGARIIVEWDDLYWRVPPWNPAYDTINPRIAHIDQCCHLADAFFLSSPELVSEFQSRFSKHAYLHPNAYDARFMRRTQETLTPGTILIRGSNTHEKDIAAYKKQISSLRCGFQFIWLGYRPYWATQDAYIPWTTTLDYFTRVLPSLHPEFVFTPLDDNRFNHCKSNIAAIETALMSSCYIEHKGVSNILTSITEARKTYETNVSTLWSTVLNNDILKTNLTRTQDLQYEVSLRK